MRKMTAIGMAFFAAVLLFPKMACADIWIKNTNNGPADTSRARETLVSVDIEIKIAPIPESQMCEGPYVLTLKYKAAPYDFELFRTVPYVALSDMRLIPRDRDVKYALRTSDQPVRFELKEPGQVSIVLYPPKRAKLGHFELELWNQVDYQAVASFRIPICVEDRQ